MVSKRAAKDKRALIVEKKVESKMVSSNVQPAKSVHFSDAASVKEGPRQVSFDSSLICRIFLSG